VIAITDEIPEQLDKFFETRDEFPERVAIDRQRQSFLAYGVSGTPTFVYVDADGKVADYSSGYNEKKGLGAEVQKLMGRAAIEE
jgi:thioredoxin-related protein